MIAGAVLAGGRGARLGGAKATAELDGRPLAAHAAAALGAVADLVVVVAKLATELPPGLELEVWHDDAEGFHPRHGIERALRGAAERGAATALVLAVDLPFAGPPLLRRLLAAGPPAVAALDGRLQPLCAAYPAGALAVLRAAPPDEPLTRTIGRLRPALVRAAPSELLNINTPGDLMSARERGRASSCDDFQ
jgi:molybdenum cofactor guanylyltransferase